MPHQRQLIREAAKTKLTGAAPTYATAAQNRVFETRMVPYQRGLALPAIAIYTESETCADEGSSPRKLRRTMQLVVEAVTGAAAGNVDDALDSIAAQIEYALDLDETLGDTCADSVLTSTEVEIVEVGDKQFGILRLLYTVTHFTRASDNPPALDEFETADIRFDLENAQHTDNEAHDIVEPEQ